MKWYGHYYYRPRNYSFSTDKESEFCGPYFDGWSILKLLGWAIVVLLILCTTFGET